MRKQLIYIICFSCFVFSLKSVAQNKSRNSVYASSLFKHNSRLFFFHNLNLTQTKPSLLPLPVLSKESSFGFSSGSINNMPFFCAMECRLRERTRLWIKFRTGDDVSYEKLIRSGKK